MRKLLTVAFCGFALLGCQERGAGNAKTSRGNQPSDVRNAKVSEVITPMPQYVDHAVLGSEIGSDGVVTKDTDSVPAGKPVYLTMFFRESPPGLQASAVVATMDKKPIHSERKEMNGAKVATFALGNKLKPGRYKVTGYWGGNIATEREFEVVGGKEKRKKG